MERIFKLNSKRIYWLDLAKAIAIIGVIVGHSAPEGSMIRDIIFSFHMPLFFIAAGFTYKFQPTSKAVALRIKNDFIRLILPAFIITACRPILANVFFGEQNTLLDTFEFVKSALFWCTGWTNVAGRSAMGSLWFFVSLFTAKTIFGIIGLYYTDKNTCYISMVLGFTGVFLGIAGYELPFNLGSSLVAVLFLAVGFLIHQNWQSISNCEFIPYAALLIWLSLFGLGMTLEMAVRSYPYYALSIIESIAATIAIMFFCRSLCQLKFFQIIGELIGAHTYLIFIVHCFDRYFPYIWQRQSVFVTYGFRVIFCLTVSFIVYLMSGFLKKLFVYWLQKRKKR